MRIFIALTPSPNSLQSLFELQSSILPKGKGQLIPQEKLHMTIVFCGDIDRIHVQKLAQLLILTDVKKMLTIPSSKYALFGRAHPKRLVLEFEETPLIKTLYKITSHEIERAEIPIKKNRAFKPHITLAKVKTEIKLPKLTTPPVVSFSKLVLFQSVLSAHGSTFTPLAQITLQ